MSLIRSMPGDSDGVTEMLSIMERRRSSELINAIRENVAQIYEVAPAALCTPPLVRAPNVWCGETMKCVFHHFELDWGIMFGTCQPRVNNGPPSCWCFKRFIPIGWVLLAAIAVVLLARSPKLAKYIGELAARYGSRPVP